MCERFPNWRWRRRASPYSWHGTFEGREASLLLQPTFGTSEADVARRWSVSKQRIPDIVLVVEAERETSFAIFDPKYRASRENILDAMQSAHVYQDSLRIGARRAVATTLIVPRIDGAPWLAAPAFLATNQVGIHAMGVGEGNASLPSTIRGLLG